VIGWAGTDVQCVTRRSRVRGCCEDTSALTPARNHSAARTAARHSPTGPTFERTSRLIRPPRTTSARAAGASSRSSPTSTSTAARPAAAPASRLRGSWPPTRTCRGADLPTTTVADQRSPAAVSTTIYQCDSMSEGPLFRGFICPKDHCENWHWH